MKILQMDKSFFEDFIGKEFTETDEDGNYLGCLEPIYIIHPEAIRFKASDDYANLEFIKKTINQQYRQIDYASNFGDLVITYARKSFHFLVFVEPNLYVHTCREIGFQYIRNAEKIFKSNIVGIFRRIDL